MKGLNVIQAVDGKYTLCKPACFAMPPPPSSPLPFLYVLTALELPGPAWLRCSEPVSVVQGARTLEWMNADFNERLIYSMITRSGWSQQIRGPKSIVQDILHRQNHFFFWTRICIRRYVYLLLNKSKNVLSVITICNYLCKNY